MQYCIIGQAVLVDDLIQREYYDVYAHIESDPFADGLS